MTRSTISAGLRHQITVDAGQRCGYCLSDEALTGAPLSVDHLVPVAAGGPTVRENLWMACRACNEFKGACIDATDPETDTLAPLFNPRTQIWSEHFVWSNDGDKVIGLTTTGRATVLALRLNRPILVLARRRWVLAGWHPPEE